MSHEMYKNIGSPLTKAVEECSEVIKIACKIDRFGWFNFHPADPKETQNIELLKREMDDVVESFCALEKHIRQLEIIRYCACEKEKTGGQGSEETTVPPGAHIARYISIDNPMVKKMTDKYFAAFKMPLVSDDELRIARQRGVDVSYAEEDRTVEAYEYNGHIYMVGIKPKGPKE